MEDSKFSEAIKRADNLESKNTLIRRMLIIEIRHNIEMIKLLDEDVLLDDEVINKLETKGLECAIKEDFNFESFPIVRHKINKNTTRGNLFYKRYTGAGWYTEDLFLSIYEKIIFLRKIVKDKLLRSKIDVKIRLLNIFKLMDLLLLHLSKKNTRDNGQKSLQVFLCHSKNDKPKVKELYHQLQKVGVEPWLDIENLLQKRRMRRPVVGDEFVY